MKDMFKLLGLLFAGLFVAVIGYPLLHEAGHAGAAVLVGATVEEFHLLPLPYVLCNVSGVSDTSSVWIGSGGILLPILCAVAIRSRHFWIWYAGLLLKGISLLSVVISVVAVLSMQYGVPLANEDMTQILQIWPEGWRIALITDAWLLAILLAAIIKAHPLAMCANYFGVAKAKKSSAA